MPPKIFLNRLKRRQADEKSWHCFIACHPSIFFPCKPLIPRFFTLSCLSLAASVQRMAIVWLAFGLLIIGGCKQESAKWNYARAMNLAEAGQLEEAIELMELALEQSPADRQIKLSLAQMLAENGQGELGIGHCDEYLESNPDDKEAHQIRSTCLQYLGRFDLSLCDYKHCLSGHVSRTPVQLNALAYYRGLANTELSKAARDIQKAIEMEEGKNWGCRYLVPMQVRTAVAAGLISRHIDRHDQALCRLNSKIEQYERKLSNQDSLIKSLIVRKLQNQSASGEMTDSDIQPAQSQPVATEPATFAHDMRMEFPFGERTENVLLNARSIKQVQKNCLGVMLATRALIHEDRKCYRSADHDRRRIQELAFDFAELAKELPDDQACLFAFRNACMYLDTRGFVSGRREWSGEQPDSNRFALFFDTGIGMSKKSKSHKNVDISIAPSNYQEALEDLDFAVLAAEFMELALNSSLYNSPELSARRIEKRKKMATRMTAVLLYHRMEVHLRGGNTEAANQDQRSIERLGFQPDASLF